VIDQPPSSWRRALLNVLITFHIALLFLWGLPDNRFARIVTNPVRPYILFAGLWHNWSMFAPSPYTLNFDMRAHVEFKDGSAKDWNWPRMEKLSFWKRIPKERFRKWRELMFNDAFAASWIHNARFVARQMNTDRNNPPIKVTLTRFWSPIAPPNMKQDFQPMPKQFNATQSHCIGAYLISAKDLQ
jgi:hypothetical protein